MKKHTVFFLGAGASAPYGYPVTGQLLPLIYDKLRDKNLKETEFLFKEDRERLLSFILKLITGWENLKENKPLITDILSLIDYAIVNNEALFTLKNPDTLRTIRRLFDVSMMDLLERGKKKRPRDLVRYLLYRKKTLKESISVISTNYDISIDTEIFKKLVGIKPKYIGYDKLDFGFSWRDPDDGEIIRIPQNPSMRLYKLHGSLNWLKCPRCGYIYVSLAGEITWRTYYAPEKNDLNTCHCGHHPLEPVLVTPSFVRDVRERNILSIWQNAGEALRTATSWYFIGYSLPPEDIAIRSMLIQAYNGQEGKKPDIHVVQLKKDGALEERYKAFFPFPTNHYHTGGLEKFLQDEAIQNNIIL